MRKGGSTDHVSWVRTVCKKCLCDIVGHSVLLIRTRSNVKREVTQTFILRPNCDIIFHEINTVRKFDDVRL